MNILLRVEYGLWKVKENGKYVNFGLQHVNRNFISKRIMDFNKEFWEITDIVNEREFKARKVEGWDKREYHFRFLKYVNQNKQQQKSFKFVQKNTRLQMATA